MWWVGLSTKVGDERKKEEARTRFDRQQSFERGTLPGRYYINSTVPMCDLERSEEDDGDLIQGWLSDRTRLLPGARRLRGIGDGKRNHASPLRLTPVHARSGREIGIDLIIGEVFASLNCLASRDNSASEDSQLARRSTSACRFGTDRTILDDDSKVIDRNALARSLRILLTCL